MQVGFITSNPGKLKELQFGLAPLKHNVIQLQIPYPEIQANTLADIAGFGFKWLLERIELESENSDEGMSSKIMDLDLIILEDSGLFVHTLDNFPGVYSKFVFKTIGYKGVLELMKEKSDRSAHFESCIGALFLPIKDDKIKQQPIIIDNLQILTGICNGEISAEAQGDRGFGYDPIFIPEDSTKTFAQMSTEEKNKHSHRGSAIKQLLDLVTKLE